MKKVFTLLAVCAAAFSANAQEIDESQIVTTPESGQSYVIVTGNQKTLAVTLGEDENGVYEDQILRAQQITTDRQAAQTWKATQNDDDTWTFTCTVDEDVYTMYWNPEGDETAGWLFAGTMPSSDMKTTFSLGISDDETSGGICVDDDQSDGNGWLNVFRGQAAGHQYGAWSLNDNGSRVYFVPVDAITYPHWDFEGIANYTEDPTARFFLQFNRAAMDRSPNYLAELRNPGATLYLTSVPDTVTIFNYDAAAEGFVGEAGNAVGGQANLIRQFELDPDNTDQLLRQVWHVVGWNIGEQTMELENEAGEQMCYSGLQSTYNTRTATGVKGLPSQTVYGSSQSEMFMAYKDRSLKPDTAVTKFVVSANSNGSECYNLGYLRTLPVMVDTTYIDEAGDTINTEVQKVDENGQPMFETSYGYINGWGGVYNAGYVGTYNAVADPNNAIKFVNINQILDENQLAALDEAYTAGISGIKTNVQPKSTKVYTIDGRLVGNSLEGLSHGVYIKNGKKYIR